MQSAVSRLSKAGVARSVRDWRAEATNLRDLSTGRHLDADQRDALLGHAQAAERRADLWADCLAQEFEP